MAKEYIERNGLLKWTREFYPEEKVFASAVINAPTADVQEVRHGKWIKEYLSYGAIRFRCSVCNGMVRQMGNRTERNGQSEQGTYCKRTAASR